MSNKNQAVQIGEETEVESHEDLPATENVLVGNGDDMKSHTSEQSESEPRFSWLHVELVEYSVHCDHIRHCEDVLILREGFTSKTIFTSVPSSKINHSYLENIGIIHLGVQRIIMDIHKKLCEELSCSELARIPANAVKWLRSKLNSVHALPHLQRECEWKLVVQEGITSKDLFAGLPENVFHAAYLRKIGIEALGMQHVLLEWHAELHFLYLQQLNYMARTRNDLSTVTHSNNRRCTGNRNAPGRDRSGERAPHQEEHGVGANSMHARKRGRDPDEVDVDL